MYVLVIATYRLRQYFLQVSCPLRPYNKAPFFIWAILLLSFTTKAQSSIDTLDRAKKYKADGRLQGAAALLEAYHAAHPTDLNSTWVYAQTMYWAKKFKKADGLYKEAIKAHPNNYYLQLDYADFLVNTGESKKAKPILTNYRTFDSTSTGFKSALANMYWEDKHRKRNETLYRNFLPPVADTLNKVKQLKDKGKYRPAYQLLKLYYKGHQTDFNTTWLFAQTAYLNKHFKKSKKLYKSIAASHPDNYYLKLDYANTLTNIADYNKALPLLNSYAAYDSTNAKLQLALAKVYLAQGSFALAEKQIKTLQASGAYNKDVRSLLDELHLAKASWVKIKGSYTTDSQPLQNITPSVEAGVYLHPEATLKINLQTPVFINNGLLQNAEWLQIGDLSSFRKSGFQLSADAGIVKQPYENKISWTANVELKQTLLKHLILQAQAERKPYYYTASSLDTVVMVTRAAAYIEWNDMSSWNGRLTFEYNGFADKNYTLGGAGWIFTPPLKLSIFEGRVGYAYSFNTAKDNKFIPSKTLSEILTNYDPSVSITGVYSPYFTPDNMGVHSALASIIIHPLKIFDIGFNANVGFYASALTPYFYLDKNAADATVIVKSYATEKFHPMEFSTYFLLRITEKISLKADYTYRKTYFYTSNSLGLGLKINFWNEQKGH